MQRRDGDIALSTAAKSVPGPASHLPPGGPISTAYCRADLAAGSPDLPDVGTAARHANTFDLVQRQIRYIILRIRPVRSGSLHSARRIEQ